MKKTLCLILSALMLLPVWAQAALAAGTDGTKNETPVIFIAGFTSTDTVDEETGERIFPPSADSIKRGLRETIRPVLDRTLKGEFHSLDYPLNQAVLALFDGLRCDENGDPVKVRTTAAYKYPTPEAIRAKYHENEGYTADDHIYYSYDWRLDMRTLAGGFHDFIEYVLECTGAEKVDVIAYSMGTCVLSSYLAVYGTEYLDQTIFYCGAFNGSSFCGDAFKRDIEMDAESTVAFLNGVLGTDARGELVKALVDVLHQEGVTDLTAAVAGKLVDTAFSRVRRQALKYIFGRMPGFWAMIPYEDYDYVRNEFAAGMVTDAFYEKTDFYHEVQGNIPALLSSAMAKGVNVSVIAKYGYPNVPVIASRKDGSDAIVDTCYASIGATAARYDTPFPEDYAQVNPEPAGCVSPDRMIDASTCAFPEKTWFIKNSTHLGTLNGDESAEYRFMDWLIASGAEMTVENEDYPRFMIEKNHQLEPLTAENDASALGNYKRENSLIARLKQIFEDLKKMLRLLFVK